MRALETEVKDLKDLLDEKDEKIDVLSRIHSFSPQSHRSAPARSPPIAQAKPATASENEDLIHVKRPSSQPSTRKSSDNPYTAFVSIQGYAGMLKSAY